MKVAFLLSGNVRSYKEVYSSFIEKIIAKFSADVFFHTWETKESISRSWWMKEVNNPESVNEKELLNYFKPCKYIIESNDYLSLDEKKLISINLKNDDFLFGFQSMYYSRSQALKILENYEKEQSIIYDYVIYSRFDIGCIGDNIKFSFEGNNDIYLPLTEATLINGVGDIFAYGNRKVMNKYLNVIRYFENYIFEMKNFNLNRFIPEVFLKYCLLLENVEIKYFHDPIVYIQRESGKKYKIGIGLSQLLSANSNNFNSVYNSNVNLSELIVLNRGIILLSHFGFLEEEIKLLNDFKNNEFWKNVKTIHLKSFFNKAKIYMSVSQLYKFYVLSLLKSRKYIYMIGLVFDFNFHIVLFEYLGAKINGVIKR